MKKSTIFFTKNWGYNTLIGCAIYFTIACTILYIDESIRLLTILLIFGSAIILPISSTIFKYLFVNIWRQVFYSFIFPLAVLICLYVEKTPGLNKAQPLEKLIIFILIWGLLFVIFYATSKLSRRY